MSESMMAKLMADEGATEEPEEEQQQKEGGPNNNTDSNKTVKTIYHSLRTDSNNCEQIVAAALVLALAILCCFGIERLAVYWSKDTSRYYNPNYSIDDNVDDVILHSTLGFLAFLTVPIWLIVAWFLPSSRPAIVTASALSVVFMIAMFATVPLIEDPVISDQSGTAVTITAVVWAIWWVVTCLASGIVAFSCCCRRRQANGRWGVWAWWIRFMGMTVFGFALLSIFYALSGNLAGSAVALITLFVTCVALSEWIVWRGVVVRGGGHTN